MFYWEYSTIPLVVYPNPTSGIVQTDLSYRVNTNATPTYALFNRLGQLAEEGKLTENKLNLSGHPPGLYFLEIAAGEHRFVSWVMKR